MGRARSTIGTATSVIALVAGVLAVSGTLGGATQAIVIVIALAALAAFVATCAYWSAEQRAWRAGYRARLVEEASGEPPRDLA